MARIYVLSALFVLASVTAATAQTGVSAFYGELRGGATSLFDADLTDEDAALAAAGTDLEARSDIGWLAEGALGYGYANGGRMEVAVGYRRIEFDEIMLSAGGSSTNADLDGDVTALTAMANVYYDFNAATLGASGPIAENLFPFIGLGIGAAMIDADIDEIGGVNVDFSGDDTVFAWQLIAGITYQFSTHMAATISYNFFSTSNAHLDGVKMAYDSHNVLAGIRFRF